MTDAIGNPPPKPPNCPESPELANITLPDGTLADVRIFKLRDTILYVPLDWRGGGGAYAPDHEGKPRFNPDAMWYWSPDIHFDECPGVVHEFIVDPPQPRLLSWSGVGIRFYDPFRKIGTDDIQSDTLRAISLTLIPEEKDAYRARRLLTSGYRIDFNNDIIVVLRRNASTQERGLHFVSPSLLELVEWLTTPPAKRDNERTFQVEIQQVPKP